MKTNKKELERLYNLGLKLEKQGDFDGATDAYQQALKIDPQDFGGIKVRLASMGRGEVPEIASRAYVSTLFDQNAEMFDYILVDQLGYNVPFQLRDTVGRCFPEKTFDKMLDLGCGTGLSGEAFEDITDQRTGVDLSENMVEISHEKMLYEHLFVGDVIDFVNKADEKWNLIVATDVLPYMGDIKLFFNGVSKCLEPNGLFGFSTEILSLDAFKGNDYSVGPHQRFAHQQKYIEIELSDNKLRLVEVEDITVRAEQGEPVPGQLYLVEKVV